MARHATVYYSVAQSRDAWQPLPLRRRLARHYHATLAALTRWASGSDLIHVSVCYRGVVLEPSLKRNHFIPEADLRRLRPTVVVCQHIAVRKRLPLHLAEQGRISSPWRSVLRWWTRGRFPARDCVTIVSDMLRAGGVPVPPRVFTPIQLQSWISRYESERVSRADAIQRERLARHVGQGNPARHHP